MIISVNGDPLSELELRILYLLLTAYLFSKDSERLEGCQTLKCQSKIIENS